MRGRVTIEALGRSLDLRFTANALCRLEEKTGRGVAEIVEGMAKSMRVSDLRVMLWAGIDGITVDQAGEIIDQIGFARAGEIIGEAFNAAFPQDGGEGNVKGAAA